ncbi:MAG TPA: hypothetical protein VFE50_12575 [Cyclobacteriaceae bacterium]|nr:hypothetical protein [Cyclobacteriaceae bacterium]
MHSELSYRKFASFWSKYRPAILKMMQGSLNEWQEYQFMKHELNTVEKKPKGGFNFRVIISMSKASLDSSNSEIAKDFIDMLRLSQTGSDLIATNRYEIVLEKNQMLRINRQSIQ